MKRHYVISGFCSCLVALSATSGIAAAETNEQKVHGLFSVPFFIENNVFPAPVALEADFTLKEPAILESFFISCAGKPSGALLTVDGGPQGVNGTKGVGADASVGLVVGTIASLGIPLPIDFNVFSSGASVVAPTHLGLPVKSKFSFNVFPNSGNSVQCNGNFVFRDVD